MAAVDSASPRPHRDSLEAYLDSAGRVVRYPSRATPRRLVLRYLADGIPADELLSESEINRLLSLRHSFGDAALLRRELYEAGFLDRTPDGFRYRRCG